MYYIKNKFQNFGVDYDINRHFLRLGRKPQMLMSRNTIKRFTFSSKNSIKYTTVNTQKEFHHN